MNTAYRLGVHYLEFRECEHLDGFILSVFTEDSLLKYTVDVLPYWGCPCMYAQCRTRAAQICSKTFHDHHDS